MRRFLIEAYTPAGSALADIDVRARRAAAESAGTDSQARFLRPIFIPEDETCFYLLDASSSDAAIEAMRRAGVSPQRVTEVARESGTKEQP